MPYPLVFDRFSVRLCRVFFLFLRSIFFSERLLTEAADAEDACAWDFTRSSVGARSALDPPRTLAAPKVIVPNVAPTVRATAWITVSVDPTGWSTSWRGSRFLLALSISATRLTFVFRLTCSQYPCLQCST